MVTERDIERFMRANRCTRQTAIKQLSERDRDRKRQQRDDFDVVGSFVAGVITEAAIDAAIDAVRVEPPSIDVFSSDFSAGGGDFGGGASGDW